MHHTYTQADSEEAGIPNNFDMFSILPPPSVVRHRVSWYRSRNIQTASQAAEWLVEIDAKRTIDGLIEELNQSDPTRAVAATDLLAAFGELALKPVLKLLDQPAEWQKAVDVLSLMDGRVVPHLVRFIESDCSFDFRAGVLRALTNHSEVPEAERALREGLCDPDPIFSAWLVQTFLEFGPVGQEFLRSVFPVEHPVEQVQVA
jgi:HEAT repeat protein